MFSFTDRGVVQAAPASGEYRVLAPIESGDLLLFPVVRENAKSRSETPFLTLDEGLKSGEVEVTEAGKAQGLVRSRDGHGGMVQPEPYRGDQVNTLVLVNHSKRPLLMLAGEIVTGGKQDRVIAKDRIVPANAEPIDLSVFCIEPGRWTESSAKFGTAAKGTVGSFMVQPQVRQRAMVEKDQQQVWSAVGGAISTMNRAATPSPGISSSSTHGYSRSTVTTSYAKTMQSEAVNDKVDAAAAPLMKSRDEILAQLRKEDAVGVVVAVHGEIIWADVFADSDLLARYWTKLVRSYAAESLDNGAPHGKTTIEDAQRFLNSPVGGNETSEGEVGIYRYKEIKWGETDTFVLESLLPGTGYPVHISKLKVERTETVHLPHRPVVY
ncbi:ARPP-1 family domain-containing protein [Acidicapsa dinghuensis]|uniref:ARPP-1 family domain-containing protein n=1 Tax=Acidicapsa dinghuensis TaxID=2218256 RepID=A0ABW1E9X1_9BACT|nr:DUF6569 family protein [Acidicapsa dinghuensis]